MASVRYSVAGVYRTEKDVSEIIRAASTSVGAMVTRAQRGPCNREVITTDFQDWTTIFGNPYFLSADTPVYGYGPYQAERFHSESNELHTIRIVDENDRYPAVKFESTIDASTTWQSSAGIDYTGVSAIQTPSNPDDTETIQALDNDLGLTDKLLIGALGPGTDGQNIGFTLETFNTSCDWLLRYDDFPTASALGTILTSASNGNVPDVDTFDAAISAVGYSRTSVLPIASKVFKISVYTKNDDERWADINSDLADGTIALSDLTPVEEWYGTMGFQKDASNAQLRIKDKVNGSSQYIYTVPNSNATLPDSLIPMNTYIFPLSGGAVSQKDGTGDNDGTAVLDGWEFFRDREYASVNILLNWDYNTTVKQLVAGIAADRMDCIAQGQSGELSDVSVASVKEQEAYGFKNASYMALYAGWDLVYDRDNDRNLYIPKSIWGGTLMARVDRTRNTWAAPAGINNGTIQSLGQNKIFKFAEIGQLQDAGINTSRFMKAYGHVMWGQKTAQIKASALDRINVRRLLIFIENSVEIAMLPFCFDITNDEKNRLRIEGLVNTFLDTIKSGDGGIERNSRAYCNAKNNTSAVIDANQLVLDLFIIPKKIVEVIRLNTIIAKSGVTFEEVIQ